MSYYCPDCPLSGNQALSAYPRSPQVSQPQFWGMCFSFLITVLFCRSSVDTLAWKASVLHSNLAPFSCFPVCFAEGSALIRNSKTLPFKWSQKQLSLKKKKQPQGLSARSGRICVIMLQGYGTELGFSIILLIYLFYLFRRQLTAATFSNIIIIQSFFSPKKYF